MPRMRFIVVPTDRRWRNSGGGGTPAYLINEEFTTTASAPLTTPRPPEPGPGGNWTITDTGNRLSITGGRMVMASSGSVWGDPGLVQATPYAWAIGRVFGIRFKMTNLSGSNGRFGFSTGYQVYIDATPYIDVVTTTLNCGGRQNTLVAATDYEVRFVCMPTICLVLLSGGAYGTLGTSFKTIAALMPNTAGKLFPAWTGNGARYDLDHMRLWDDTQWMSGTLGKYLATTASGTTLTASSGDGVVSVHWSVIGTTEVLDLVVRQQDASNKWIVRIAGSAAATNPNKIYLVEVNAGVETVRSSLGAVSVSKDDWIIVGVILDGTSITAFANGVSASAMVSYTSASFQSATGIAVTSTLSPIQIADLTYRALSYADTDFTMSAPRTTKYFWATGDSKTDTTATLTNAQTYSMQWIARYCNLSELTPRGGHGGYTTATLQTVIDADLAAVTVGTPDYVFYCCGVNDLSSMPTQTTFKSNLRYIWRAIHTKWASAVIVVSKIWRGPNATYGASATTLNTWIAEVKAESEFSYVTWGDDEQTWLQSTDDGARYSKDSVHPTIEGSALKASLIKTALGL